MGVVVGVLLLGNDVKDGPINIIIVVGIVGMIVVMMFSAWSSVIYTKYKIQKISTCTL